MAAALKEFFNSADAQEVAARSVWSLPVFGIQVRIQAVELALCAGGFEYAPAALEPCAAERDAEDPPAGVVVGHWDCQVSVMILHGIVTRQQ
jgi:hypothetical protein